MSPRNLVRKIIKIGLVVCACLVCLELLMIVTDPYLFKDFAEYDPDLGFRARAYFPNRLGRQGLGDDGTLTNQFGFNDRDYPLQKLPGTFRIAVVGDSFSWAGGLEGNYTARLERRFETQYGSHRVDVINTGYPGTHTGEQLLMLKKFGLQYNPDLVILGFFAGNDFIDADPNRKRIIVNHYYYDIDKRYEHRWLGYPIIFESRIRLFLRNKFRADNAQRLAKEEADKRAAATGQPAQRGGLAEETFYFVQHARLEFFNRKTSADKFGPNINYIFASISEMNELLKSRGTKFVVAIYPDEFQVDPTQFNELVERYRLTKEDYDLNRAQDLLKSFLISNQIPFIDMLDRFRAERQQRQLYRFRDTHWNDAGNELAAQILFEELNKDLKASLPK